MDLDKPTPIGPMMGADGRTRMLFAVPVIVCPEDLGVSAQASTLAMTEAVLMRARRQVEHDLSNSYADNKRLKAEVAALKAELAALKGQPA
jgi:hypothetical protein